MAFEVGMRRIAALAALLLAATLLAACAGGPGSRLPKQREIPLALVSAELRRFEPALSIGAGKTAIRYQEALVVRVAVQQADYDAQPPDIEPFLYVGERELHTFALERPKPGAADPRLLLTFHLRDFRDLPDAMPLVLTTDHGAPQREPRRFADAPALRRGQIVDRR